MTGIKSRLQIETAITKSSHFPQLFQTTICIAIILYLMLCDRLSQQQAELLKNSFTDFQRWICK